MFIFSRRRVSPINVFIHYIDSSPLTCLSTVSAALKYVAYIDTYSKNVSALIHYAVNVVWDFPTCDK